MKRKPYSIDKEHIEEVYAAICEGHGLVMEHFRDHVITSIRFSFPHGRERFVINGRRSDGTRTSYTVIRG